MGEKRGERAGTVVVARRLRRTSLVDEIRNAILQDFIRSGEVPAGERLPSETELSERYGVSRVTVRSAIRSLQDARVINSRQGLGTVVLPQADMVFSGLDRLSSIDTFAREAGATVNTEDVEVYESSAEDDVAVRLRIAPGSSVVVVRRGKTYLGVRIGWIVDYLLPDLIPLDTIVREFHGSLLDVLLEHPELRVAYADCELVPVLVDGELARKLRVEEGRPALYMDEVTCRDDGLPLAWARVWLLPDHLRFVLRRRVDAT